MFSIVLQLSYQKRVKKEKKFLVKEQSMVQWSRAQRRESNCKCICRALETRQAKFHNLGKVALHLCHPTFSSARGLTAID